MLIKHPAELPDFPCGCWELERLEESWLWMEAGGNPHSFPGKYGISEERGLDPQGTFHVLISLLILNK